MLSSLHNFPACKHADGCAIQLIEGRGAPRGVTSARRTHACARSRREVARYSPSRHHLASNAFKRWVQPCSCPGQNSRQQEASST
eukprot:359818-Chlamydomonas_euryale.AAC.3